MKITLKRTNKGKKRKSRRRYKKRSRRNLFGGASNIPVVFKFTIIGGQKDDEENWIVYDHAAELLSNTAKKWFRLEAAKQLSNLPHITKYLEFKFETELFVFSSLEARDFDNDIAEIIPLVNSKNDNIRQSPSVENLDDGLFYKFGGISMPGITNA